MAEECPVEELPDEDSHPREFLLYSQIDVDGDQILTKEEVEAFFVERGMSNIAGKMMETMDTNGDGGIDFQEFVQGYDSFKKAMAAMWEDYESPPQSSPEKEPEPEPEPAEA